MAVPLRVDLLAADSEDVRETASDPGAAPTSRLRVRASDRSARRPSQSIVAKLASGRYHADGTSTNWCKIKNPGYTQMTARHELFERRTGSSKRRPMLRV